jgi:hypothetical protein
MLILQIVFFTVSFAAKKVFLSREDERVEHLPELFENVNLDVDVDVDRFMKSSRIGKGRSLRIKVT